jgi:predicted TIM-barrel fold metal-dependent hydrolase
MNSQNWGDKKELYQGLKMDPAPASIVDFHTHIGDVCGGCYREKVVSDTEGCVESHLLERSSFNPHLIRLVSSGILPKSLLISAAQTAASLANGKNLIASMTSSGIGKSLILPIAPFVQTQQVVEASKEAPDRLIPLISVNFVGASPQDVKNQIENYCNHFPFRGIKFHPNIQRVDPSSHEARILYETAAKKDLFIIIHGGITPILFDDSRRLAVGDKLLPILEAHPNTTFVVAHAGSYFNPNNKFLENVAEFKNVYADTSGVGPDTILSALNLLGPERVIFGSDWPYGTQTQSLSLLRSAIYRFCLIKNGDVNRVTQLVQSDNANRLLKCQ